MGATVVKVDEIIYPSSLLSHVFGWC